MKSDLLSLSELASLWGKRYQALKRRLQRGRFTEVVYLHRQAASNMGLSWHGNGSTAMRNPQGRPYISIEDPAIPDFVRKKYYAKITTGGPSSSPSLSLIRGGGIFSARPGGGVTHNSPVLAPTQEDPRPGKDIESLPAVGHGTITSFIYPPPEGKRPAAGFRNAMAPEGASASAPGDAKASSPGPLKEIAVLPGGASLKTPGKAAC